MSQEPLRCGWPSHFIIETRDQYGDEIFVPGIKVSGVGPLNVGVSQFGQSRLFFCSPDRSESLPRQQPYLGGQSEDAHEVPQRLAVSGRGRTASENRLRVHL